MLLLPGPHDEVAQQVDPAEVAVSAPEWINGSGIDADDGLVGIVDKVEASVQAIRAFQALAGTAVRARTVAATAEAARAEKGNFFMTISPLECLVEGNRPKLVEPRERIKQARS
jgi:hypothetical protein